MGELDKFVQEVPFITLSPKAEQTSEEGVSPEVDPLLPPSPLLPPPPQPAKRATVKITTKI